MTDPTTESSPAESPVPPAGQQMEFQAEVGRLLEIVTSALYSDRDVFLRELISNASDACDRRRYAALTDPSVGEDGAFEIRLVVDAEARTLTVSDNGIGMDHDELVQNLGTIARSGTARFLSQLQDARKDGEALSLIGQFGVGFYAAFMVADKVDVITRKAGTDQAWHWQSDGRSGFSVATADKARAGTDIVLHLKADETAYLDEHRLSSIVRKHSDHIAIPVRFGTGDDAPTLNQASALWLRPKNEITEEQYSDFYRHVGHGFDAPWATLHWRAEGVIEYAALLFLPSQRPFDLFDPGRAHRVKLYVRRVFIADATEGLVAPWLRFLRGVVDSQDLPLNVSREMLQSSPVVAKIRGGITKKVLSELERRATDDAGSYATFWEQFGAVLKEGLYEDREHQQALLKLVRFRSTSHEGWSSLADYVARMRPGQEQIYTIAGTDEDALRKSPQIEGFRARGIEVLLLTDPVDEFWPQMVGAFDDRKFQSVTRGGADLSKIEPETEQPKPTPEADAQTRTLVAAVKETLGDAVRDVRISARLTESAVCLVADEGDPDIHLARLLQQHGKLDRPVQRVLEINPSHPLIAALSAQADQGGRTEILADAAWILLDQARILEGETLPDPTGFARRLSGILQRSLGKPPG